LLLAVVLAGCSARTEIPAPLCLSNAIVAPWFDASGSTCALVDGRCPEACFTEEALITDCASRSCLRRSVFACHRRETIRFAAGCGVRIATGEIYEWSVERPLPSGFRACVPGEHASPKIDDELTPVCPIAGER
jgi:hypothetical protein